MPLKLIPPGHRKGNPFYLVRGNIAGQRIEVSTGTADQAEAEYFAKQVEEEFGGQGGAASRRHTFKVAAELYEESKSLSKDQQRYVVKVKSHFQNRALSEITPVDAAIAANKLYPDALPQTKNRQCISVIRAIMNLAAENKMVEYQKFRNLKEDDEDVEIAYPEDAQLLIDAVEDKEIAAVLNILAYQGWRITETLAIKRDLINFENLTIKRFVSKSQKWKEVALDPEVARVIAGLPEREDGYVFKWRARHNFYRALSPILDELNVHYTPHMSRRGFATALLERDVNMKAIQEAGQWEDIKSVARYAKVSTETTRATLSKLRGRDKPKNQTPKKAAINET